MLATRTLRAVFAVALAAATSVGSAPGAAAATAPRDPSRFACAPGLTTPFTDVGGTTHAAAIACAVHYGLTGGTTPTTFDPGAPVTRGQMATFLVRLVNLDTAGLPDAPSAGFHDTSGTPHERSIDALVALGIAGGTGPGTFSPSAPVTRGQMATFLRNTVGVLGMDVPVAPPDAFADDEGGTHEASIDAVALLGLAGGTSPTTYGPGEPVTRGAMATFLARTVDLGIEEGLLPPKVDVEGFAALGGAGGRGTGVVYTTDVPGVVCFEIVLEGVGTPGGATVRVGPGGPEIPLPTPQGTGFTGGCVTSPHAAAFGTDVEVAQLEITDTAGLLLVGGVFGTRGVGGVAELESMQVVPPGDANAFGIAGVFVTSRPGVLCISAAVVSANPPTAVHVHEGPPHQNGPVVAEFGPVEPFGVPISCRETPAASAFAANMAGYYVDVHSTAFPDGALRGQLEPA